MSYHRFGFFVVIILLGFSLIAPQSAEAKKRDSLRLPPQYWPSGFFDAHPRSGGNSTVYLEMDWKKGKSHTRFYATTGISAYKTLKDARYYFESQSDREVGPTKPLAGADECVESIPSKREHDEDRVSTRFVCRKGVVRVSVAVGGYAWTKSELDGKGGVHWVFIKPTPTRGEIVALANDVLQRTFRFAADKGLLNIEASPTDLEPATANKKPQAVERSTIRLTRQKGSFKQGIVLDGNSVVSLLVTLKDHNGKPIANTPVNLSVWQRLPSAGVTRFPNGKRTDQRGRMVVEYLPPRITQQKMRAGKWAPQIRFTARANLGQGDEPEVQVKAKLWGLVELGLQVERAGYASPKPMAVGLADPKGGTIKGRVVFQTGKGVVGTTVLPDVLPVNGATIRLLDGSKRPLGEAQSDADGYFELTHGNPAEASGPAETTLPEPIIFTAYERELAEFVRKTGEALASMQSKHYGYQVGPLQEQFYGHFPQLIASAADAETVALHQGHLVRIGLLVTAIREMDDLGKHASAQFADSLVNVMDGLMGLANIDPLRDERFKIDDLSHSAGRSVGKALHMGKGFKNRVAQYIFSKLKKNFVAVMKGVFAQQKHVTWYWLKKILMKGATDIGGKPWKEQLVSGLMENYHADAQKALQLAAKAWASGQMPQGIQGNLMIRHRYAQIAAFKQQVTHQQLDLELYKSDIDLGFDVIGQGIVVAATLKGGAVAGDQAAKIVGLVNKGMKALTTGADAYVGFQWLKDYIQAQESVAQFTQAALLK